MKTILILAVLGAALWFGMKRLEENAAVKKVQDAPAAYTKSLQEDVSRAQKAASAAAQAEKTAGADAPTDVDAR